MKKLPNKMHPAQLSPVRTLLIWFGMTCSLLWLMLAYIIYSIGVKRTLHYIYQIADFMTVFFYSSFYFNITFIT